MGVIGDWFRNKALPWLGNQVGSLVNRYTGAGLTGAEREANEFSAGQAQISREWDEKMYNQYNSPSALVSQYQSAGINPALMFGGQTPAAPQSSGEPSSVSPAGSFDLLGSLMQMAGLKANIEETKARTDLLKSQKTGMDIENQFKPEKFRIDNEKGRVEIGNLRAGLDKIRADIGVANATAADLAKSVELKDSQISLNFIHGLLGSAQTSLANAQSGYISSQKLEQDWRNSFEKKFGMRPESSFFAVAMDSLAGTSENLASNFEAVFGKIKSLLFGGASDDNRPGLSNPALDTLLGVFIDAGLDDKTILNAVSKFGVKVKDFGDKLKGGFIAGAANAAARLKYLRDFIL